MKGDVQKFKEFVNKLDVVVPANTLYTIDKVVRDRLRQGRYGIDFSEYINLEKEEENKYHYYHNEMLRTGKTSIQIPYVPHSVMLAEKLAKSPILPENKPSLGPSEYKSIRGPKTTKRAKTIAKYGSCRKGKGTMKEEFSDWRMRQRANDRLKARLIEQAKQEVRQQIYHDMLQIYQLIRSTDAVQEPTEEGEKESTQVQESEEKQELNRVPTFADEDLLARKTMEYKNFSDFCWKTKGKVYPNPIF